MENSFTDSSFDEYDMKPVRGVRLPSIKDKVITQGIVLNSDYFGMFSGKAPPSKAPRIDKRHLLFKEAQKPLALPKVKTIPRSKYAKHFYIHMVPGTKEYEIA